MDSKRLQGMATVNDCARHVVSKAFSISAAAVALPTMLEKGAL